MNAGMRLWSADKVHETTPCILAPQHYLVALVVALTSRVIGSSVKCHADEGDDSKGVEIEILIEVGWSGRDGIEDGKM